MTFQTDLNGCIRYIQHGPYASGVSVSWNWQNMDSAPKDGTRFLIKLEGEEPRIAAWIKGAFRDPWTHDKYPEESVWMKCPE